MRMPTLIDRDECIKILDRLESNLFSLGMAYECGDQDSIICDTRIEMYNDIAKLSRKLYTKRKGHNSK